MVLKNYYKKEPMKYSFSGVYFIGSFLILNTIFFKLSANFYDYLLEILLNLYPRLAYVFYTI